MNQELYDFVSSWTRGKIPGGFCLDSGYYAGSPPNTGHLNSAVLEGIYQGLKSHLGLRQARNFVRFVNHLTDLSASSFITAFERFFRQGCMSAEIIQRRGDRTRITAHGDAAHAQAFAIVASALSGRRLSEEEIAERSEEIKRKFIADHLKEIPPQERHKNAPLYQT